MLFGQSASWRGPAGRGVRSLEDVPLGRNFRGCTSHDPRYHRRRLSQYLSDIEPVGGGARPWLDRLLPHRPLGGDSDVRMRRRLLVQFSVLFAALTLPWLLILMIRDPVFRLPRTIALLGVLVIVGNPLWLRRCSTRAVAVATTLLLHPMVLAPVAWNGGVFGPVYLLVAALPVITAVLVSLRAAWLDGVLLLALAGLALHIDASRGLPRAAPIELWPFLAIMATVIALTLMLMVVSVYTNALRRQAEELTAARDQALAASRAKSSFLSTMSHELRTPMVGVLGTADLLATHSLGDEARRLLNILQRSAHAQLELIGDILDLSRIEADRLQIERIAASPRAIVEETAALFLSAIEAKGLTLRVDLDAALPLWILSDPQRLRQILGNLVSNALKFTARGTIVIAAAGVDDDPPRLRLTVTDTGIGIPADKLEHILEDFTQAEDSINRRYGGSGLGLAISRRLVAALGGTLSLTSEYGHGSTFVVEVPAVRTAAPAVTPEPPPAPAIVAMRPLKLLVTDDDPITRTILATMLAQFGHSVLEASDGAEALAIIGSTALDLLIIDIHMPGLDGPTTARTIRLSPGPAASLPILGLTADVARDRHAEYLRSGLTMIENKPISMPRLEAVLQRLLA